MCVINSGSEHLLQLQNLLRRMHLLHNSDPSAFYRGYAAKAKEAVSLMDAANFEGYAMQHRLGPTVLHYAAGCGCLEVCSRLLERCIRLNFVPDAAGQTPLFWAAACGFCGTVDLLLRFDANGAHLDEDRRTALHLAAAGGFARTCVRLLAAARVLGHGPKLQTLRGQTPLHSAAEGGHAEVTQLLLEAGADAAITTAQGRTALHMAAMAGHSQVVQRLLAAKPEVIGITDVEGMRALDYACERGLRDVVRVLSVEDTLQEQLRRKWRASFEPQCRASLNVPLGEAFLEIGQPHLLDVRHTKLRLMCRVVDVCGLIQSYTVNVEVDALYPSQVLFARLEDQSTIDDVEFQVPRRSNGKMVWRHGDVCRFSVSGVLSPAKAELHGIASRTISSVWTAQLPVPL